MALIASILLAWLVLTLVLIARRAGVLRALWHEPMLVRPVVIVESDDWGPGPARDAAVLARVAERLAQIRDADGHPAVMTLGVVLGKPDGAVILADGCRHYHRDTLAEPRHAALVEAMRAGCAAGVFALQRHGLEHCWPESLLVRARDDDTLRQWLADPEARSEALPSPLQSRWVDAAKLPSTPHAPQAVLEAAAQEREVFASVFGAAPAVAVPNTFVWNDDTEHAWAATGVRWVVTCGRQYTGRAADGGLGRALRQIRNGEAGRDGLRYVVRDVYFEPIRGHRAEAVWEAVAQRSALGRPSLLETHRESFIDPAAGEATLAELDRALRGVLARHPDVRFMSTEALCERFMDRCNPLHVQSLAARCAIFLRRLHAEPGLSRSLKLCGLYFVLPLASRLLTAVKPSVVDVQARC